MFFSCDPRFLEKQRNSFSKLTLVKKILVFFEKVNDFHLFQKT
ncbi:hypothetical protein BAXH7_00918 [Bacillus amyloliquefaciens XH7]|nr:hypothetical protein BAMTA208_04400 [Bacillus amyloliquefaciens TA208]AEB62565.1 hypothetical protein LL3_01023 [Bacillus amyloliquefaciens LL3]AEK88060.1 hypothetical protein BAXH7_00918 [Bacillus amyloliquefaciens XH7]KYC92635.1 hypothetical protein B425_0967 [Bacillus amyloliquefaciens]QBG55339.1 hypothetical protein D2M30_1008 [Bacillus amyloliquefaciens]